ncbi:VWA domain-containing protein [Streptomyces sp. NBC_01363]|uniref:VWA domain-containing protein n=1 Tax=Streptomyces sp. NBC_01363 TaxID=2903840 RepID=UPI00225A4EC0|nr:VWA domain-containing protein [Streptomyces sp. NBC_01363]MCX4734006.1 VWA domain-containing protein [Streptomyces sp. NBC_01363]
MTGPAAGANGTGGPQGGPAELRARLERTGHLVDEGLAIACFPALRLHRPLVREGDAGVGKTALAPALADVLGAPLIRLQCYEGIDASQALYDWDFPRQLLHLRAAEAAGITEADRLESELYSRRFPIACPLLQAVETQPSVLLVDEVDRADDEFEAFLDRWGQRSCARGAVVVVLSDGWERADPALLAAQMRRLHRLAHRVVRANPRKAHPGYAPLAAGMAAALPHVDAFVEEHSLAALEHLAAVVRGVASDA